MVDDGKGHVKVDEQIQRFAVACPEIVRHCVAEFRFELVEQSAEREFARCIFRNGDRYIEIEMTIHYRDGPPHCSAGIGEGTHELMEATWNQIALWQLFAEPDSLTMAPYSIGACGSVEKAIDRICDDLRKHASDFLSGDLDRFYALRRESARRRPPIMMGTPRSFWFGYKWTPDPDSVALKERYSK